MAKRPIKDKQMRRLRKAINRRKLPAYIDLVHWLKTTCPEGSYRAYAQTSGAARKLLEAGRVKVDSHVVGRVEVKNVKGDTEWVAAPLIPAEKRTAIRVEAVR